MSQSEKIHDEYRQASDKFDYFITGVTIAICGFLVQTYQPIKLSLWPLTSGTLELMAIIAFLLSIFFGLMKIEKGLEVKRVNYWHLKASEERDAMRQGAQGISAISIEGNYISPDQTASLFSFLDKKAKETRKDCDTYANHAGFCYSVRNCLFLAGISFQVVSKIIEAYV